MKPHTVFLGIPIGADGTLSIPTHRAVAMLHATPDELKVNVCHHGSSALTMNFNQLWCDALNGRLEGTPYDVFGMIHTDIAPKAPDKWLLQMLEIFDRTGADVLSVIQPIKNALGLTSTAIDTSRWTPRRLTMQELFRLPPTFDGEFIRAKFGAELLLNTGLMLVRMTEPWALDVCFNIDNCTGKMPDGRYHAFFEPEDWKFSRWANARGLKLVATREVECGHLGGASYDNNAPWGQYAVDSTNLINGALGAAEMIPHR